MTDDVLVAAIAAVQAVLIAWLGLRVRAVGRDAAAARHQLEPNSGSTPADALTRIETKLIADYHRITGIERRLEDHIEQSATLIRLLTKEKR